MYHEWPVRVYYQDTDAGGVVYHANYINFAERGRMELLRDVGYINSEAVEREGILFVVHRLEADYLDPARLDDSLIIRTTMGEIKNSSFTMRQDITRGGKTLCAITVRIVCINTKGRPVRVPDHLREKLAIYHKEKELAS